MSSANRRHHRTKAHGLGSAHRLGVLWVMAAIALLAPACVWQPTGNDNDPPANVNDNDPNTNENDNDAPPGSEDEPLPPEPKRFTIQSQCGQLILECPANSFPAPVIEIVPIEGQQVTATENGGFVIEGVGDEGIQAIQLAGINTEIGSDARFVNYQWSYGALDFDPCTLEPGPQFSVEQNPLVYLEPGLHYIRLTVANDIQQASVVTAECVLEAAPAADFLEIEIEIRP